MSDDTINDQDIPSAFIDFHGDLDDPEVEAYRRKRHNQHQASARYADKLLSVHVGDITEQIVDAIVNAANPSLMGGAGVDGAIHRAAGSKLREECAHLRDTTHPDGLATGEAVITGAGELPARYVIHTVGPVYGRHQGREAELLAACYRNALALADEKGCSVVAFPAISTGIYGYPPAEAAQVVFTTLRELLPTLNTYLKVRLIFWTKNDADIFIAEADKLNGVSGITRPNFR